jgi:hypothetical protein
MILTVLFNCKYARQTFNYPNTSLLIDVTAVRPVLFTMANWPSKVGKTNYLNLQSIEAANKLRADCQMLTV